MRGPGAEERAVSRFVKDRVKGDVCESVIGIDRIFGPFPPIDCAMGSRSRWRAAARGKRATACRFATLSLRPWVGIRPIAALARLGYLPPRGAFRSFIHCLAAALPAARGCPARATARDFRAANGHLAEGAEKVAVSRKRWLRPNTDQDGDSGGRADIRSSTASFSVTTASSRGLTGFGGRACQARRCWPTRS